jgi:hypothetical protein
MHDSRAARVEANINFYEWLRPVDEQKLRKLWLPLTPGGDGPSDTIIRGTMDLRESLESNLETNIIGGIKHLPDAEAEQYLLDIVQRFAGSELDKLAREKLAEKGVSIPVAAKEIESVLSTYMQRIRERVPTDGERVDGLGKRYGAALVPYLDEYATDPCERVRRQSYMWTILVALDSNDVLSRQAIVCRLLGRMQDDVPNGGHLASRLVRFEAADFSAEAKELVRQQFHRALEGKVTYEPRNIILLVGVADLKSELPRLKQFAEEREELLRSNRAREVEELLANYGGKLPDGRQRWLERQWWEGTLAWAALRARARMGVKEDIQRCIELVEAHPNEDYKVTRLLRELMYVRQPEVVDYIYEYLGSDRKTAGDPPCVPPSAYASHAAWALSKMVRGFPIDRGRGRFPAPIERCREWMAEQKQKQQQAEKPQQKKWDIIR